MTKVIVALLFALSFVAVSYETATSKATTIGTIDDEDTTVTVGEGSGLVDDEDALEGSGLPPEIKYSTKNIVKTIDTTVTQSRLRPVTSPTIDVVQQDTIVAATTTQRVIVRAPDATGGSILDSNIVLISIGILLFLIVSALVIVLCCCRSKRGYQPGKQEM